MMQELCKHNADFHCQILFSNEATFCIHDTVNCQNFHYWSREHTHWMVEAHT